MMKETNPEKIRNIVVLRTDRIGEVLLSTPVIDSLKTKFPKAEVSFVTSAYSEGVVSNREDLKEVLIFSTIAGKSSLVKALFLSQKLRNRNFDLAVVLNPHKMLHLAIFLAGIPVRVGFDRKWGALLNRKIKDKRDEGKTHEVNYNLELLETIGIRERDIPPSITVPDEDRDFFEILFAKYEIDWDRKIVVISTGTSNPAKQWPIENFTELIRRLVSSADINIVLIGEKGERAVCEKIISDVGRKRVFDLAGLLTVSQLAGVFKWADLVITNDNGSMHIAAALGKKVVAFFGRNIPGVSPVRWSPFGKGHVIFHKDPGCSPCYDRKCPYNFKCLRSITPEEVFEAVKKALK
ncbi:MAG: lipopolysaccharide heptosyltransferase II [Candidatus Omnitrophota bacterium]